MPQDSSATPTRAHLLPPEDLLPPAPLPHPPPLTETAAEDLVRGICFKTGPPRLVGAELEWLLLDAEDPGRPLPPDRLTAAHEAARALPLRSRFTVEPGGQLELSSPPAASLMECVGDLQSDLAAVRAALGARGVVLDGCGHDLRRPLHRLLDSPRYSAMETYFDRTGPAGRAMMRASASVQVCVDAGHEEPGPLGHGRRWRFAHLLGAVLVSAFANSPAYSGPYMGWRCSRQGVWSDIDTSRALAPPLDSEPREAWTRQALDTAVMCVRPDAARSDGAPSDGADGPGGDAWEVPRGLTFRGWLRGGGPRPPTTADLEYHLTTLFPPVRPRGHLELRMIDAQPGEDGWVVPVAVVHALFDDPEAAETAYRVAKGLADAYGSRPAPRNPLWRSAARYGPGDPELRTAALSCFRAAAEALPRLGADTRVRDAVGEFNERFVLRGRCPADETDEARARTGARTGGARPASAIPLRKETRS
ncbi:ergothioneine biosynthesis glutamate--cysteine ligase EgtA [Streptomyces sp. G-G2]|uniref:ergothioneine biosynthesis glutamate--cysteine ligase EgtA n=1 Tax=Streptomyces sp. G-G2 TaxID=3046201 RepID=UPI0024B8B79D|nr:ergothioneine biosynthesis glutamate--cysteine ligase EgtA [Streptomyces sp. G-G2]MDJ0379838.1 ergothioneine biosynthesis glutamate--cysteine ligase EgtA [Streptomyces sp. G-G2]